MDISAINKCWMILPVAALVATGCNNPNAVLPHSPDEQKAYDRLNAMTPQQRIDAIEKGPMPAGAKAKMIQEIKDKAGIK